MKNGGRASSGTTHRIGIIADTHGLLRDSAREALRGVELILHAGDVGTKDILERLGRIAPVESVRGNVDTEPGVNDLPPTVLLRVGEVAFFMIHNLADLDPATQGIAVVVSGHSHKAGIAKRNGVLFVNPGSAGPRRFALPATLAIAEVRGASVEATIVRLDERTKTGGGTVARNSARHV